MPIINGTICMAARGILMKRTEQTVPQSLPQPNKGLLNSNAPINNADMEEVPLTEPVVGPNLRLKDDNLASSAQPAESKQKPLDCTVSKVHESEQSGDVVELIESAKRNITNARGSSIFDTESWLDCATDDLKKALITLQTTPAAATGGEAVERVDEYEAKRDALKSRMAKCKGYRVDPMDFAAGWNAAKKFFAAMQPSALPVLDEDEATEMVRNIIGQHSTFGFGYHALSREIARALLAHGAIAKTGG